MPTVAPLAIGVKAVQVLSGVGVFPTLTWSPKVVPAGMVVVAESVFQFTISPASQTRETNVPAAAYGVKRAESTTIWPPPTLKSLITGLMGVLIAMLSVATTVPSIK